MDVGTFVVATETTELLEPRKRTFPGEVVRDNALYLIDVVIRPVHLSRTI